MLTGRIAGTFKTVIPPPVHVAAVDSHSFQRGVRNPATATTILRRYWGLVIYPFHRRTQSPSVLNCELGTGLYPPGFLPVFLQLCTERWATIPDSHFQWAPQREPACLVGC